ncbi:hypothetical protein [Nocardia wallacei]|nr:hypothetical protein [Nocardia wallacei]
MTVHLVTPTWPSGSTGAQQPEESTNHAGAVLLVAPGGPVEAM